MFETLKSGGIIMIPIILCGVIATYIIINRLIYFASTKKRDKSLLQNVLAFMKNNDFDSCVRLCREAETPVANIILKAIQGRDLQEKDLREVVETQMDLEVPSYEHLLTTLGTIANIATLLGLLGTVTGNNRPHSLKASRRTWKANLQKVRIIDEDGKVKRVYVSTRALRSGLVKRA